MRMETLWIKDSGGKFKKARPTLFLNSFCSPSRSPDEKQILQTRRISELSTVQKHIPAHQRMNPSDLNDYMYFALVRSDSMSHSGRTNALVGSPLVQCRQAAGLSWAMFSPGRHAQTANMRI